MSIMQVNIHPKAISKSATDNFISYCLSLPREKNVICNLRAGGVTVEGKRDTILEIIRELDDDSFVWSYVPMRFRYGSQDGKAS